MTCAISWIPRGVSKSEPSVAVPVPVPVPDPPSKKKKDILLHSSVISEKNENHEDEDVVDSIANASTTCDNISLALKDLHMERYDDEDQGIYWRIA